MDTVDECDRRTDRRTDGQTDRITITDTVQRIASHGKNLLETKCVPLRRRHDRCSRCVLIKDNYNLGDRTSDISDVCG